MDPFEELANGIVLQAVKDYREALKMLRRNNRYSPAQQMRDDCEHFFTSEWFSALTKIDGPALMRKLNEEAA